MQLKHTVILVLVLVSAAARADCEADARKAREMILTSGPFEYKSRQWNENFDRTQKGLIEPGKAEHIIENNQNGRQGTEEIYIGKKCWENDGFGWLPPWNTSWGGSNAVPDDSYEASNTKCLGTVVIDGKSLIGYELKAKIRTNDFIEKFYLDLGAGKTVRYERIVSSGSGINVISTYRFDAAIKIEPPKVDLADRQAKSLQVFQQVAASADPKCRQEIVTTIERSQTASPFRYEIVGAFWSGISGMHGTFVPPNSIYNIVDGAPYHGGGSETLRINGQAWKRNPSDLEGKTEWPVATSASPSIGVSASGAPSAFYLPGFLANVQEYIGGVACLGEVEKNGSRFRHYEYDIYADARWSRTLISKRRMFVQVTTGLPVLFEDLGYNGQISRRETRTHDEGMTLKVPEIAQN